MNENTFKLKQLAGEQRRVRRERAELAKAAKQLRAAKNQAAYDFISDAFDSFLEKMHDSYERRQYVHGRYSDDFTRHVSRDEVNQRARLSLEHDIALREYREAFERLNETFVQACLNSPEETKRKICELSTLKKL